MRQSILFLLFLATTVFTYAQTPLDTSKDNNSIAIPAVPSTEEQINDVPEDENIDASAFELPTIDFNLNTIPENQQNFMIDPKFYFDTPDVSVSGSSNTSYLVDEKLSYDDPGEFYTDRLNEKTFKSDEPLPPIDHDNHFGDFMTEGDLVTVRFRDFGMEDGDIVSISRNGEPILTKYVLTNKLEDLTIYLTTGFNKFEFKAENIGMLTPNTGQLIVLDHSKIEKKNNQWYLGTGESATFTVYKK